MQHKQPMQVIRHDYITQCFGPSFILQRLHLANQLASIFK